MQNIAVAASFSSRERPSRPFPESPLIVAFGQSLEYALHDLESLPSRDRIGRSGVERRIQEFDHHLCHAASAFYPSPFDRALILTLDEDVYKRQVHAYTILLNKNFLRQSAIKSGSAANSAPYTVVGSA